MRPERRVVSAVAGSNGAPEPGDVLAGKYRVERVLGEGGMGIVVAAYHLQLDQRVALKFLLPAALEDPVAVARFVREARTAVRIKSEHVATVSDVGELENGAPYMVMEYLEGGDLDAWLRDRGKLPVEQAVEFVLQACVAVADAHALGVVHRDLKPSNLFCVLRTDGQLSIKVLDFGISKVADEASKNAALAMTKTTTVMGTPLYMSPEQMNSAKGVDARTDLWALGVILYELITGTAPFTAASVMELAVKIATQPPPSMQSLGSDAPPGLEAVILKCLEKNPADRYPDVGELAMALAPFAPDRARASVDRVFGIVHASGLSARAPSILPPSRPSGATLVEAAATIPGVSRTMMSRARGRSLRLRIGVVAAVALAGVATFALYGRPSVASKAATAPPPPPSSSMPASPAVLAPSAPVVEPTAAPPPTGALPATAPAVPEPPPVAASKPPPRPVKSAPARASSSAVAPSAPLPVHPPTPAAEPVDPLSKLQMKK